MKLNENYNNNTRLAAAYPKVLVACPTYDGKAYGFDKWVARVKEFTYPNYEIFCVDNSQKLDFFNHWKQFIPMERLSDPDPVKTMLNVTRSMAIIQQKFLAGDYQFWFNLEADIIPPIDVLERMLVYDGDWISHAYPIRGGRTDDQQGIGCSLLARNLMKDFDFSQAGDNSPDGWLWDRARPVRKYKTIEIWGEFLVDHLKEPES